MDNKNTLHTLFLVLIFASTVLASLYFFFAVHRGAFVFADSNPGTNINSTSTEHWAWSDVVGWIDFHWTHKVLVTTKLVTGYASSSIGDISLSCDATGNSASKNVCGAPPYGVTNDGCGYLSGWGWNDTYGWISFDCHNTAGGCAVSNYQTRIDPNSGQFHGFAWNDITGWISFNCADPPGGFCGTSPYQVITSWAATSTLGTLDSAIFDTGANDSQLNSFIWHGVSNDTGGGCGIGGQQASVNFQFAAANSTSSLVFMGPGGTSNLGDVYSGNTPGQGKSLPVSPQLRGRFFEYRVILTSDQQQLLSPRVDDVVVNWSP